VCGYGGFTPSARAQDATGLRYRGLAPDAQLTGGGGFAFAKPLDNPFLGRAPAGLMYLDSSFMVSLGPTLEVGALAKLGVGGELEITAGPRLFGNIGVARVDDAQWMSHATLGWFVFGLEWQHLFASDVPRDALLFGVRLPLGLWWLRQQQKSEGHRPSATANSSASAPQWLSRATAVKRVGDASATQPAQDELGTAAVRSTSGTAPPSPRAQAQRFELVQASLATAQRAREQGDAAGEVLALARAYELSGDPQLALQLAAAIEQLGRYVAALATLRHALRLANPSAEQRVLLEGAAARLQAKLPHLRLTLEGAVGDERVLIDDVLEPTALAGYDVPVDPGEHRLTVERGARTIAERTWQAHDAELVRISLTPNAAAPAQ